MYLTEKVGIGVDAIQAAACKQIVCKLNPLCAKVFHATNGANMSHDMTKPTKRLFLQWRLGSAWPSAQSDQGIYCLHEETLGS